MDNSPPSSADSTNGSNVRSALPHRSAADLEALAKALTVLADLGHDRMTVRQALFLFAVAHQRTMGQSVSIPRIREIYEPLGRSIEKSKDQFLAATKRNPEGLGWMTQEADEDDRRQRYLDLSPEGIEVVGTIVEAMRS